MHQAAFVEAVLAGVRTRLQPPPTYAGVVGIEDVAVRTGPHESVLTIIFDLRSPRGSGRYGWSARIWPHPGYTPGFFADILTTNLAERVAAADLTLDGPTVDGVIWLSTPPPKVPT